MLFEVPTPLAAMPFEQILLERRALQRRLAAQPGLHPLRIALLGGSTTQELASLLELHLLEAGFAPTFYHSAYGRYQAEALHDSAALEAFRPDLVYLHTTTVNLPSFPPLAATEADLARHVHAELAATERLWDALARKLGCLVIQNNFELPPHALLGNLDALHPGGHTRFILDLNHALALSARPRKSLILQDIFTLAARLGQARWFSPERWFAFKLATSAEGAHALAQSLAALIRAAFGRTRKVLVLDLDNTLWGGVIGDDGPDHIRIGPETPLAEAYTAFQLFCLALRDRGILLAVCSKNDEAIARAGFAHPDSILKLEHIASFQANWDPKPDNIARIAKELNLGPDTFVFLDDNPAERALVAAQVPGIAVPDIGSDVTRFPEILEAGRYFEPATLSPEDLQRADLYRADTHRAARQQHFADYGQYLDSLQMSAEIDTFKPVYLDRIAQLTNKTNQFNLTTRRYTLAQLEAATADPCTLALYGKLTDRFGENGLVSVLLAHRTGNALLIDLWLMSCRVLKRTMEHAMLDALANHARALGIRHLEGAYRPTRKNALVAQHYDQLGFKLLNSTSEGAKTYTLDLTRYRPLNHHIRMQTPCLEPELAQAALV